MWLANHASEWIHGDSFALLTPALRLNMHTNFMRFSFFKVCVYTGINQRAANCTARSWLLFFVYRINLAKIKMRIYMEQSFRTVWTKSSSLSRM